MNKINVTRKKIDRRLSPYGAMVETRNIPKTYEKLSNYEKATQRCKIKIN